MSGLWRTVIEGQARDRRTAPGPYGVGETWGKAGYAHWGGPRTRFISLCACHLGTEGYQTMSHGTPDKPI